MEDSIPSIRTRSVAFVVVFGFVAPLVGLFFGLVVFVFLCLFLFVLAVLDILFSFSFR